jgi:hypothetical protein
MKLTKHYQKLLDQTHKIFLNMMENKMTKKSKKTSKKKSTKKKGKIGSSFKDFLLEEEIDLYCDTPEEYCVCITFAPVHSDVKVKASSPEEAIEKVKEILGDHIEEILDTDVWAMKD